MPKIPRITRQPLQQPAPIDPGISRVISSGVQSAKTGLDIATEFRRAKDVTKSNELLTQFQLDTMDEWDKLKQERADNPENLSEDFDALLIEKRDEVLDASDISSRGKAQLSNSLNQARLKFKINARSQEKELMVDNYALNVEKAADINEELSFRTGRDFNFATMAEIDKSIKNNILAGSSLVSKKDLSEMRKTQISGSYSSFVKGMASTDPLLAIEMLETDGTLKSKLSIEEREDLKKYALSVKSTQEKIEKDPRYRSKTTSRASTIVTETARIQSEFDKFEIGSITKKGKVKTVVKTPGFNSIEQIIDFRDDLRNTWTKGNIEKDSTYIKMLSDTNNVMINMLRISKTGFEASFWGNSASDQIINDLNKINKDGDSRRGALTDSEYVGIYENTVKELIEEDIDPKSTSTSDKVKAQEFYKKNLERASQLRTSRNDAQQVLSRGAILPLNSEAKSNIGTKLDNGWDGQKRNTTNNKLYNVEFGPDGVTVIRSEEVK